MGKKYKNQSALSIRLTVNDPNADPVDITNATTFIKYKKPSGVVGEWPASIIDAAAGIIEYDIVNSNDIDEAGNWIIWADVTFPSGKWAPGEPVEMYIYEPGQ